MPKTKYMETVSMLSKKPVFTLKDMVAHGIPATYVRRLADYLVKKRKISRVERGKFTVFSDPITVAPFLVFPSYLSMTTALHLRGAILQVPHIIQVATTGRRKNKIIEIIGARVEHFKLKRALFFGYTYIDHEGVKIPVADAEKAIVDLAYFGFEPEGELSVEVDQKKLEEYTQLVGKTAVKKRVGRWLDASAE